MKTLHKTTILFLLAFIFSSITFSQVVVTNKLTKPDSEKKAMYSRAQIWMSGEWVVSGNEYVWEEGSWVDKRPGYIFLPGYWKKVTGGWTWVSGSWQVMDMKQWTKIYA